MSESLIVRACELAREKHVDLGVDTDAALDKLATFPISRPCRLGDDGFTLAHPDPAIREF